MTLIFDEKRHRYELNGQRIPSVTTLLSQGIPKPGLMWWAAEEAGKWCWENRHRADVLGEQDFIQQARKAHNTARDKAAIQGTQVHDLAELIHAGEEVQVTPVEESYLTGYLDFLDDWEIEPVLWERPIWGVVDDHLAYGGKFDLIARSPYLCNGEPVLLDLKTSKSVYDETALQLAAYANAEQYVTETGEEATLPVIAGTFIVHVTPTNRDGENARYKDAKPGSTLHAAANNYAEIGQHFDLFKKVAKAASQAPQRKNLISIKEKP